MVIAPAVLSIAEEVPLVGKAVRVLKKFVAVWEKTNENVEAFNKLRKVVDRCMRLLEEYLAILRSPEISENIKSDMDALSSKIEESADLLEALARLDEEDRTRLQTAVNFVLSIEDEKALTGAGDAVEKTLLALQSSLSALAGVIILQNKSEEDMKRLFSLLEPKYFSKSLESNKYFEEGTREWLFGEVKDWMGQIDGSKKTFWLHGDAGMGKTAFSSQLSKKLKKDGNLLAALFFNFDGGKESLKPRVLLNAICYQLAEMYSEVREPLLAAVKESGAEIVAGKTDDDFFSEFVLGPLESLSPPPTMAKVIIIDALDEAGVVRSQERRKVLVFLKKHFLKLPSWVKIYVTSRPEDDIIETLKDYFDPHMIAEDDERHRDDLKLFITATLRRKFNDTAIPEGAEDVLLRKSEGKFVYLAAVFESPEYHRDNGSTWSTLQDVEQLPDGLDDVYRKYFHQLYSRLAQQEQKSIYGDGDEMRSSLKKLLRLIVASCEPLPRVSSTYHLCTSHFL